MYDQILRIIILCGVILFPVFVQGQKSASEYADEARKIAQNTLITDGHVDFPYRFRAVHGEITAENQKYALHFPQAEFDFEKAKKGGLDAPFMSAYIPASYQKTDGGRALADSLIRFVEWMIEAYPDRYAAGNSPAQIEKNRENGLISLPIGMENGAPIGSDLDKIDYYFERGIRYVTLTHSKYNQICDSSYDTERKWNGLSPFGIQAVQRMNEVGMMIDVSHISDSAFYQVIRHSKAPVIASHSSCRKFTPGFERNMSDDMIRALKENGGVIQINFGSDFLDGEVSGNRDDFRAVWPKYLRDNNISENDPDIRTIRSRFLAEFNRPIYSTVSKVADHIDHVVDIAGIDYVGLGSDFDGVGDSLPEGLKTVEDFPNLIAELLKRGYSRENIEKICYKNVWRVWNEVLEYGGKK